MEGALIKKARLNGHHSRACALRKSDTLMGLFHIQERPTHLYMLFSQRSRDDPNPIVVLINSINCDKATRSVQLATI